MSIEEAGIDDSIVDTHDRPVTDAASRGPRRCRVALTPGGILRAVNV
jgi:hypothetical protein